MEQQILRGMLIEHGGRKFADEFLDRYHLLIGAAAAREQGKQDQEAVSRLEERVADLQQEVESLKPQTSHPADPEQEAR